MELYVICVWMMQSHEALNGKLTSRIEWGVRKRAKEFCWEARIDAFTGFHHNAEFACTTALQATWTDEEIEFGQYISPSKGRAGDDNNEWPSMKGTLKEGTEKYESVRLCKNDAQLYD